MKHFKQIDFELYKVINQCMIYFIMKNHVNIIKINVKNIWGICSRDSNFPKIKEFTRFSPDRCFLLESVQNKSIESNPENMKIVRK